MSFRTLVHSCRELVVVEDQGRQCKTGTADMNHIAIIRDGAMLIAHDGTIAHVGTTEELRSKFPDLDTSADCVVDASGKCVLPGFVDGHQHPVFAGDRCHEFEMKLSGASYMDIHQKGGGIGFTVEHTRAASAAELESSLSKRLDRCLRQGTVVAEAKSGYGLHLETELKMLRVINAVDAKHPIDLVANYTGAHSVPKGSTVEEATRDIIDVQIPAIVALRDSGELQCDFIDVFCEKGVFEAEHTRRILEAGLEAGFKANFHGDELNFTGSAELGAELGVTAISHLECVSEAGIAAMARAGVVGVLLPVTAYVLRIEYPPARRLIDQGVPVALASDFNPNAHCMSLPFVANLACVNMRMTCAEALNAITINAAKALDRSSTHGSLEPGKQGDFILLDAPSWQHLIYQLVDPPIEAVYKAGQIVFARQMALL